MENIIDRPVHELLGEKKLAILVRVLGECMLDEEQTELITHCSLRELNEWKQSGIERLALLGVIGSIHRLIDPPDLYILRQEESLVEKGKLQLKS